MSLLHINETQLRLIDSNGDGIIDDSQTNNTVQELDDLLGQFIFSPIDRNGDGTVDPSTSSNENASGDDIHFVNKDFNGDGVTDDKDKVFAVKSSLTRTILLNKLHDALSEAYIATLGNIEHSPTNRDQIAVNGILFLGDLTDAEIVDEINYKKEIKDSLKRDTEGKK